MASNTGNGQTATPPAVNTRSVQRGDVFPAGPAGVFNWVIPTFGGAYVIKNLPPDAPPYVPNNKYRDTILSITPNVEGFWADAVHIATTKLVARDYKFEGDDEEALKRMREMFDNSEEGAGYHVWLSKMLRDFFTTDNGAWCEIIRASDSPGAEIVSFSHLDSLRCWRTGDPEIPIYYYDLLGRYHEMKWYQVFNLVDQPSARAGFYHSGLCAAARAWRKIRTLAAKDVYIDEKLTGGGYTEIEFINGVTEKQIRDAMAISDSEATAQGLVYFKGKLMIPILSDAPMSSLKIPLKSLPDGFDDEHIMEDAHLTYAKSLGLPPTDLNPRLTAKGALGVGAQTQIIDDNFAGYGAGEFDKQLHHQINRLLVPEDVTFSMSVKDLRDEQLQASVKSTRAQTRATRIAAGEITAPQALQLAYDDGDAPIEFLPGGDVTGDTQVDDTESVEQQLPDESQAGTAAAQPADQAQAKPDKAAAMQALAKEIRETREALVAITEKDQRRASWLYRLMGR